MAAATSQEQSRFPITLWPATPLAPVLVERWSLLVGVGGALDWPSANDPEELPHEWVLRQLGDTDLDDDDAVAALLGEYGVIAWPYFDPAHVPADRRHLLAETSSADERDRNYWWEQRSDGTLEDARWWLKTSRALAGTWREVSFGRDPGAAWATEGFPAWDVSAAPAPAWAIWGQFSLALNYGLRAFQARVEHHVQFQGGDFTYGLPRVGLYSAACRQVFNFIAEDSAARRCENATCGRVFVRQLGGAKFGQYRSTGLRYCTPECARAETQRQYRRRKAARTKEQQ
jgi:hypothetical protein